MPWWRFLGATVLRDFGAELFVVDLTTYAFLREFGVLLTAILLAGRAPPVPLLLSWLR